MLPNRKAAALGALTLAGALLAVTPAQAETKPTPKGDGAKAICKRLPKTEKRITAAITRLNGDATVPGSVARLEQRVANAKAAGHTEIYTYLNDRLTFRKSLLPTLQTRQTDLKAVATWCAAQGATPEPSK
ncbi:hypothetical protein GCM10010193_50800 [Kitasatospora atroaurantiaca]|uniref:Hemophore-related protein n=1 Tax=Kitasatospora atroaurantiaca TaxID=285545 RepID=A0A561EY59_9ACTN|nr:hypothetical protein [Kitasatospora atroaurantiaca]TWE20546.1 hypothetical protein FB465_5700 [Kitasatospora atroaurantiaca]